MQGEARGWIKRLAGYCWRFRKFVLLSFGASLIGMTISALIPLLPRLIIDDVIVKHEKSLTPWAILLIIAAAGVFVTTYIRRYYGGRLAVDVQHELRVAMFRSLSKLDGPGQDRLETGQVVGRATSDLQLVQGLLSMIPVMTGNVLMFIVSLVIMISLSIQLSLIVLAIVPLLWWVALRSRRRLFPATWYAQQQAANVAGVVDGAVTGVRVVKGFGQEEQERQRLEAASSELFAARLRGVRLNSRFGPTMQMLPALGQIAMLAAGGVLAAHGEITLGTFVAFSTYVAQMVGPVRMLTNLLTMGQQARAGVERVFEVIDTRPVMTEKPDAEELDLAELEFGADPRPLAGGGEDRRRRSPDNAVPALEFDNVVFGYGKDGESRPVLDGFNLRIRPGETVALVGSSGCGKTTVANLVPRFYDVTGGAVRIHGHDVRDLTMDSLRAAIGLVPEDSFLFSVSVKENIAFGRPDASEEEIVEAAKAAQAHGFITALPDGYRTRVGEQGLTLSGGQRQRVALARAILSDPRLLIMDDATSAVDARVESRIHDALHRVMRGRTTLLIAHRRSTLQLADRIAVLDAGRLAELGTHEELVARSALYRRLLTDPDALNDVESAAEAVDEEQSLEELEALPHLPAEDAYGCGVPGSGAFDPMAKACAADREQPDGERWAEDEEQRGITPELWPAELRGNDARAAAAAGRAAMAAGGRVGGGMHGGIGGLPPTPELLAAVEALPPATDRPEVPLEEARRPAPHFTLGALLRPFRLMLLLGLLLVCLDAGASLVLPVLIRHGIDSGVLKNALGALFAAAAVGLGVVLADWFVQIGMTRVTGRTGERILYTLRVKEFAHLQRLGLDYYERELSGRIMTRMTTDVDALSSFLQTGLVNGVVAVLTFFGILIALLIIDVQLALTVFTVLPILIVGTLIFRSKSAKAYLTARERVAVVNADLQENVAGMRLVQAFRRENRNETRFTGLSRRYLDARVKAQQYIAVYFPFGQFLSTVAAALVLAVGAGRVESHSLSAGELVAYLLYIELFFSPIQQLSQVFDGYQQAVVGLTRIRELLRTPTTTPEAEHPKPVERLTGDVRFDDVHFAYNADSIDPEGVAALDEADPDDASDSGEAKGKEALSDVLLHIPAGQTVAFVGETGAGKSTLVKLVARFYDVTDGAVRADGTDLREFGLAAYRHRLGVVPQEAYLFPGTVRDAIAYGRPGASDAEVESAAKRVGAHEMVATLSGGYLHEVSERGRNLSAGQRQLIALARAELVDPDILLLDEATAALDLASEAEVIRATDRLSGKRTTLVIAHRLTTAARADRVVVMHRGRVVEDGTHGELVARGGRYARLWRAFIGESEGVAA
ncbi:ABC transporter ATP-binding protein [Mangrovactinospora gilvigrisea]|uniref:ABC transporter ATP-binding protein n=1 Tax=Mangrovactinospora gilvigrisea TaxID=1428644 RepID=A0A1J7CCU6_9ACTN|nr:ABC transporter ATP-binding protein [Mangrovactinospora gilvigrisea]OIV37506.1 ABC transporter ATP-binding protein [Mangrovactinospora gilvigrisea]